MRFGPLTGMRWDDGWWFRVFGVGLQSLGPSHPPHFSERNGIKKPFLRRGERRYFVLRDKRGPSD